jgi:hypothetical protein
MKTRKILAVAVLLTGMLSFGTSFAKAQDDDSTADPPSRVARMNYAQGSVSFQPGGEGDWVAAVPNRPLTSGDNLWSDQNSRAELHIGSTALRISSGTSLTFLTLDDRTTQLRLSLGSLILRVRHLDDEDHFEVDTPNLAFTVHSTGEYRFDVNENGDVTDITVWHGRGEVTGGGDSYTVVAGQDAHFSGTSDLNYDIGQLPARDSFDNWAMGRDENEDRVESANYVSPEVTGYEDLDAYGNWRYVGGYGTVWVPRGVATGWAPYRYGHWVWIAPWGWTWVEDEPWGFAPFHYGRWAYAEGFWCWVPGPVVVRPVYAPALVAFVGGGGFNLAVAVGGGPGVAWFPLAPREVYVPWYRGSRGYVNNVNITNTRVNITQVTNVYNVYNTNTTTVNRITYVNQRVNNGVTMVSRDTFVNARPVDRNLARVDERQLERATVVRDAPVQPTRQSVIGAGAPARVRPPVAITNRQVVGTRAPVPVRAPLESRPSNVNVRTEQPSPRPQSLPPGANNNGRQQEVARPQNSQVNQPSNQRTGEDTVGRPGNDNRPQNVPRPVPGANDARTSNPYVRQAPPVREKTQQEQQREEQKFRNWQEQRQRSETQSRPEARPQQAPAPQRHETPKPQNHNR